MAILKLTAVGTSTGVVIPKEMLTRMKVEKGDTLYAVETVEGGYVITPCDPEVQRQVEIGLKFMKRYREAFQALAK